MAIFFRLAKAVETWARDQAGNQTAPVAHRFASTFILSNAKEARPRLIYHQEFAEALKVKDPKIVYERWIRPKLEKMYQQAQRRDDLSMDWLNLLAEMSRPEAAPRLEILFNDLMTKIRHQKFFPLTREYVDFVVLIAETNLLYLAVQPTQTTDQSIEQIFFSKASQYLRLLQRDLHENARPPFVERLYSYAELWSQIQDLWNEPRKGGLFPTIFDVTIRVVLTGIHVVTAVLTPLAMELAGPLIDATHRKSTGPYAERVRELFEEVLKPACLRTTQGNRPPATASLARLFAQDRIPFELKRLAHRCGLPFPQTGSEEEIFDPSKPVICMMGLSEDRLVLAREIAAQNQANVFLLPSVKDHRIVSLNPRIQRGAIYRGDRLYWVELKSPVPCHYYFDGFDRPPPKFRTPMASLPTMELYAGNKEVADAVLKKAMVARPRSIVWKSAKGYSPFLDEIKASGLVTYRQDDDYPARTLRNFCVEGGIHCFVVKPTNGNAGEGVEIFMEQRCEEAARGITYFLHRGRNVIVEEFIRPAPLKNAEGQRLDWNLRVFVSRDASDCLTVSDMMARVDIAGKAVNLSLTAKAMTFRQITDALRLSEDKAALLRDKIGKVALATVTAMENQIRANEEIKEGDQQDFMGIDIIVSTTDDGPLEVGVNDDIRCIEVNGHCSGGMWRLDAVSPAEERGKSVRELATVMVRRASGFRDSMANS